MAKIRITEFSATNNVCPCVKPIKDISPDRFLKKTHKKKV